MLQRPGVAPHGFRAIRVNRSLKKAEHTLNVQIDDDAFTRIYGHTSNQFPARKRQKIAVRVISQFGEETTKVMGGRAPLRLCYAVENEAALDGPAHDLLEIVLQGWNPPALALV